jgi:tetratricopeptide (TPR) repeat protein
MGVRTFALDASRGGKEMTVKIIGSLRKQGAVLATASAILLHSAVDVHAVQEPLQDRVITHGYGLGNVTVLGQVLPAKGNPLPARVWVILRGIFGYEERQLVEGERRFYFTNVPRARVVLIVEADGHQPARFDINPNDGDTYIEVTPGPRLGSGIKPSPSGELTVDAQSLKIPAKAVRELKAAGKYIQEGELDKALRRLQKSTQLHPAYDSAYNDMGVVYLKMGRYQEAGTAFSKAVEINPNFEVTQANLGLYYLVTGQREQAVEHFSRAVAIDPKPRTQVFLAEALCGVGRCSEAEQLLKRLISIDPAFSFAYRRLGYVYLELKRFSEALEMFRQFMNSPQGENASEVKQLMLQLEQSLK